MAEGEVTATYYYTRKGSPENKIPAHTQTQAECYAEIYGGQMYVENLTSPILFSSEEGMSKSQALTLPKTLGEWLTFLIAFGPALSASYQDILAIVEAVKRIAARLNPTAPVEDGGLSLTALDECETAQLEEVRQLMATDGRQDLFDGSGILAVWGWLKAHPEVLTFLVGLFGKKA